MISGFSKGYQLLKEKQYLQLGAQAAGFIEKEMYDETTKTLRRSYREGVSEVHGFADDYAFLIQGLLDLYEASLNSKWLLWANELQETMDTLFWDEEGGSYFSTEKNDKSVLLRLKEGKFLLSSFFPLLFILCTE